MEEDGLESYYLQDDLGSPMQLLDENGEIRESYGFDEFGMSLFPEEDPGHQVQPFGYTGYQMEEAGGVYYAQARRYDAGTGRFVSEDKIKGFQEMPCTLNPYTYCWNRPTDHVDLDGLWPSWNDIKTTVGNVISDVGDGIKDGIEKAVDSAKNFYEEHKEAIHTALKVIATVYTVAGVAAITIATGGTATAVIAGALFGAELETGFQIFENLYQGEDIFDIHNYNLTDICISTVTGAITGGMGSCVSSAVKLGKIAKNTAQAVTVVGNGIIAGASIGVSAKLENPDISTEELFERMEVATLLSSLSTYGGQRLAESGLAKYLRNMNQSAYESAKYHTNTPRGNQGIFRMIWTFGVYKGSSAVYTVGSSYLTRLLNNEYKEFQENVRCIE